MARDARQDVDARAGVRRQAELARTHADGRVGRERERGGPERHRIDAQREVMHDRIAHQHQLMDLVGVDLGDRDQLADEPAERGPHRSRHLPGAALVEHRVRHAAHEVLAEADLWVHHAVAGEDLARGQVGEVTRDRRRPDVDGHAEHPLLEPRPYGADGAPVVHRDGDRVVAALEGRLELAEDVEVGVQAVERPLATERLLEPGEVAAGGLERRPLDLDVVEPDDRVDLEVADREALADDLLVDLALGRDVDDGVAPDLRTAQLSRRSRAIPFRSRYSSSRDAHGVR